MGAGPASTGSLGCETSPAVSGSQQRSQPGRARRGMSSALAACCRTPQVAPGRVAATGKALPRLAKSELRSARPRLALRPAVAFARAPGVSARTTMLACAVAAMSFVVPQAHRARDRASSFVPRASGFVPRACQGQPEEPPFQVGQRVEGLFGAVCHTRLERRTSRLRARHSAPVLTPLGLAFNSRSWACLSAADGSRAT